MCRSLQRSCGRVVTTKTHPEKYTVLAWPLPLGLARFALGPPLGLLLLLLAQTQGEASAA